MYLCQIGGYFQPSAVSLYCFAEVVPASSVKMFKNKLEAHLKNLSRDGSQSNRNRTHRTCLCTCASLGVFKLFKTGYLIGYRDTSHCPVYIYKHVSSDCGLHD